MPWSFAARVMEGIGEAREIMSEEPQFDGVETSSENVGFRAFVTRNAYIITVSILFGGAGMYYARTFFPELPSYKALIAGMGFGVFCTIVALGRRFL